MLTDKDTELREVWSPQPRQAEFLRRPEYEVLYGGAAGGGKALDANTPILTADGWKTVGDIEVGDTVYGSDGKPTVVTAVTETMYDHVCYQVVFKDNTVIIADADHRWRIDVGFGDQVLTTEQVSKAMRGNSTGTIQGRSTGTIHGNGSLISTVWTVVDVRETLSVPVKCITVDAPNHLYLASHNMVPTHNSDALLMWALSQYKIPHYNGLLLRKTFPELEQLIARSMELYPKVVPAAKYNDNKHVWRLPSGARIYLGSMHQKKDVTKYQGRQFDSIGFDELTHFSYEEYSYMFSRNRPSGKGTKVSIRGATNPGGIGHAWVRGRFIDNRTPGQSYLSRLTVGGKEYLRHRAFIPATVFDNAKLLENDPNYIASMAMLPEATREALLMGSWDSFSGQAFPEWRNSKASYKTRQWSHVVDPFKIPTSWRVYRSYDFGYARPFSVMWYAMDNDGRMYLIRELYGCTGTPNEGIKWHPAQIAQEVMRIEKEEFSAYGVIRGIADPSIWDASRGESIATMMEREGCYWVPGDNKRIPGKAQIHFRLAFDTDGYPAMYVFNTCKHFIRTFPALVYDSVNVEDIDSDGEDHAYDSCRYMMMDHPIPPRSHHEPPIILDGDPLNLQVTKAEQMFIHM